MDKALKTKFRNIKLLAMDFDGIMTDGCVYVNQRGIESVKCSRKDGLGIGLLKKNNIQAVVVSTEANPVVSARCKKLKIKYWQKVEQAEEKKQILQRLTKQMKLTANQVAYMGDDLNDQAVFKVAGLKITVADGQSILKETADYITKAKGGQHAVREVCELILTAKGIKLIY